MSQIIIAKTGEDRYCLVKVYDDYWSFHIEDHSYRTKSGIEKEWQQVNYQTLTSYPKDGGGGTKPIAHKPELPKGNWQIVGIGSQLSEDQWKEIVESKRFYDGDGDHSMGMVAYYREYPNDIGESALLSATESGFSYLRSHGADENYLILKEVK